MKNWKLHIVILLSCLSLKGQNPDSLVLSFREYLGYVKSFHPVAKQAQLNIDVGQAELLRARGAFDPRIEVDYDRKEFKGTEYWDRLNTTFKIPTWYGIDLKGGFEQVDGEFTNPDEFLPADGLFSAGVSVSLGEDLWINDRMATLKQARIFRERTMAERDLEVNEILYKAALAYFSWVRSYKEQAIFRDFMLNARQRFEGVKRSAVAGEIAAIDTVEAKIAFRNRELSLEQARIAFVKRSLDLSNFLWLDNDLPVELQPNVIPETIIGMNIDITLDLMGRPMDSVLIESHPKLRSLGYKIDGLEVEKNLKVNKILPRIDLEYNFLTESIGPINSLDTQDYKGSLRFEFPIFIRKERGELKLAKYKLQDARFEYVNATLTLRNKIEATYRELDSFESQNALIGNIVGDYRALLNAEERKFSFGESSLFLINSRESNLIDSELKQIEMEYKFFKTKASLFKVLAHIPANL